MKRVALGVTGGIAAYKSAEIARLLQDCGARVQVVMTRSAQEFVRPLTFAALTGQKVITGLFGPEGAESAPNLDSAIEHIAVAQEIDALLVAPATADIIAKFANGIAGDFLTTLYLATKAPVIVAPTMNVNMWEHPATQANLKTLRQRGVTIVEPEAGYLACGMVGAGRLAANEHIVSVTNDVLNGAAKAASSELAGETVLITAGPTREPIDPVRFIGNRSSGKMGYSLAEQAKRMGAEVILVAGPVALADPAGIRTVRVETAEQMRGAVLRELPKATIVIKAAAVADYRVKEASKQKIKRKGPMTLELEPTDDIAAEIGKLRKGQILIGFAAETENAFDHARKKLESKSLDAIVLNDVSRADIGFDSDANAVTILTRDRQIDVPKAAKAEIAKRILRFTVELKRNSKLSIAK